MDYFSRPIGDIFSLKDKTYQVIKRLDRYACCECDLNYETCYKYLDLTGYCDASRNDDKCVAFKQINNMTEVKITVPEGMEIDEENSTFECIKFKPAKSHSWDEYSRKNPLAAEQLNKVISELKQNTYFSSDEIKSFIALFKLRLLRNEWVNRPITEKEVFFPTKVSGKVWDVNQKPRVNSNLTDWLIFPNRDLCNLFIHYFGYLLNETI